MAEESPPPGGKRKPAKKAKRRPPEPGKGRLPAVRAAKRAARAASDEYRTGTGNRVGRPTKYRPEFPEMLLAHMAAGESFWSFAAVAEVCLQTLQEWTDPSGPHLKPEFLDARRIGEGALLRQDERVGMAGESGQLTISFRGQVMSPTGMVLEVERKQPAVFNSSAWQFKMRNRYPNLYREKQEVAHTGPNGEPLPAAGMPQVIIGLPKNGREAKE